MENDNLELRALDTGCELRASSDGRTLSGYAAVFNSPSETIYERGREFRERILPGAFSGTLARGDDVRALADHEGSKLLGRRKSGTLSLSEDARGLYFTLRVPDTQIGRDIVTMVERGDLSGCSFGFTPEKDRWPTSGQRELLSVRLHEISICSMPAYPATSVQARASTAGAESFGVYRAVRYEGFGYEPSWQTAREVNDRIDKEQFQMRIAMARRGR